MKYFLPFLCLIFALGACSKRFDGGYNVPLLYQVDIQQGNVLEQEMLDKLRPGMDKEQVKFIMGTPVIIDPFHNERWEYVYSFQKGGGVREQRHVTLHFVDEKLSHITGDIQVGTAPRTEDDIVTDETVVVPQKEKTEEGFFGRIWDSITPD